ncbi:protein kinase [Streptosporangium sp. KLBMP 9127]|nr:protein kinase [Streptosporangium sp. KLBMP 9127]
MGVVHLAVDRQGREVAVKVLRAEVAGDDVARRRLAREVETMRRVRSEHIAEVVDADVTGHRPYIVTRYVAGQALDDVVKQDGPFDLAAVLKVAGGVASALAAVHAVGVIHRDLKPGNVLILDGEPVLIDFGIAQAVDATRLTQTGMFIGTPGYLAPEIIEGQEAGPEVDVHAWAGTMLFACSGQPPFGKGTLEMIFYNITAGRANVDAAPAPLQPLLRAAMQRDPAKRPSAAELAEQVARLMHRTGTRPRRPDEITTVPEMDAVSRSDSQSGSRPDSRSGNRPDSRSDSEAPTPAVGPSRSQIPGVGLPPGQVPSTQGHPAAPVDPRRPGSPADAGRPGGDKEEYVSLLGEQPPPGAADPWPTRRVTPEELRQARERAQSPATGSGPSWDVATQADLSAAPSQQRSRPEPPARDGTDASAGPSQPWDVRAQADGAAQPAQRPGQNPARRQGHGPPVPPGRPASSDGDIPTQRVRPNEIPEYIRNQPAGPFGLPAPNYGAGQPGQAYGGQPQAATPYGSGYAAPYPPQVQAGYPGQEKQAKPGRPGQEGPAQQGYPQPPNMGLQRSKAYGVASVVLLVIMAALTILAPMIVVVLAIPLVVVLRAADLAQPQFGGSRPAGAAALDVIRVLSQPAALVRSAGITLALVPYGLILGLPVTLLFTVLVRSMPVANALSWGTAVALVTIAAGPGVEGPSRQMRRTLASLAPARNVIIAVVGVLAAVAALMTVLAVGTLGEGARAQWAPISVDAVETRLDDLRKKADQ